MFFFSFNTTVTYRQSAGLSLNISWGSDFLYFRCEKQRYFDLIQTPKNAGFRHIEFSIPGPDIKHFKITQSAKKEIRFLKKNSDSENEAGSNRKIQILKRSSLKLKF